MPPSPTALGLPTLAEHHFHDFEAIIQQKLGFQMNAPQREIMRTIAGLEPIASTTGSLMIQAAPGAGKTTLIVMTTLLIDMMKTIGLLRTYPRVIALAHMRQNRAMLENYLPPWVDKSTVHKYGWQLCQKMSHRYHIAKWKIPNITYAILKEHYPMGVPLLDEDNQIARRAIYDMYWDVARFIEILVTSLVLADNRRGIEHLYEIYTPSVVGITEVFRETLIDSIAPQILQAIDENRREGGHMSFPEMVTVPIRAKWLNEQYDIVLVDEGQDLSPAQQIVTERIATHKFVVGDRNQALMKFAGADVDGWHRLRFILDAQVMTMPITQRCPELVVRYLQRLFSEVIPRKDAPKGNVGIHQNMGAFLAHADRPATGIICRTHADVAEAYVALMQAHVKTPLVVLGSDVYGIVKTMVGKLSRIQLGIAFTSHTFLKFLRKWQQEELMQVNQMRLQAQRDVRVSEIKSHADTVRQLFEFFQPENPDELVKIVGERFGTSPDGVPAKQKLFKKSVVVGTAYAWKGLETRHIIIYNANNYLDHRNQHTQEEEVLFVAMSRAQESLFFHPYAPLTPASKIDYTVRYVPEDNKTLPYPGFDTSLFLRQMTWGESRWSDDIWTQALDDITRKE